MVASYYRALFALENNSYVYFYKYLQNGTEKLDVLFQERIDANEKIEPRDYMPEEY